LFVKTLRGNYPLLVKFASKYSDWEAAEKYFQKRTLHFDCLGVDKKIFSNYIIGVTFSNAFGIGFLPREKN